MAKQAILIQKPAILTNGKLLTDRPLLDRGMNLDECRAICTSPEIPEGKSCSSGSSMKPSCGLLRPLIS
jgi:hypothetical protein